MIAGATPSLTLVAIEKLPLKLAAGVSVTPASSALTSAIAPRGGPHPGRGIVGRGDGARGCRVEAAGRRVRQRQRCRHVGAVDVAHHDVDQVERGVFGVGLAVDKLVAVGASFTAIPVIALLPVIAGATPSLTLVAIEKLPLKFARRRKRHARPAAR